MTNVLAVAIPNPGSWVIPLFIICAVVVVRG
ncbi:MAG: hypothetical protein QG671_2701 [Actinomycetota bacterium]|jgi:hypothetical protein|nr:hypothetical protein [Actinomycetota bacterium]